MDSSGVAKLEPTWERVLQVWWAALWRIVVFVLVPALVAGFLVGAFSAFLFTPIIGQFFGLAVLFGMSALLSVPLCKMVLLTKFDGFSLALLAEDRAKAPPPQPTSHHKPASVTNGSES